jgi:hypothetical protein
MDGGRDVRFANISVETFSNLLWSWSSNSSTAAVSWPWASEFWKVTCLVRRTLDAIPGCYIPVETEETRPLVLGRASLERETWDLRPLWTMYN